jgi:hypothetical protein
MNTGNIFMKLSTAVALVAVLSTAGLWEMRHVQAVSENQRAARFSAVTIARGQSMKISVANINPAEVPPDPYRVQLGFMDADGNLLRDPRTGEAMHKTVVLQNGQSTLLALNGDDFVIGDAMATGLQVRPFVLSQAEDKEDAKAPPDPTAAVLEVIDNATSKTSFLYPGSANSIVIINSRH